MHEHQPNIFDAALSKPAPRDTRALAREKVNVRELQIRLIKSFYLDAWNADAWADANGVNILSVRPRVAELKKAGLLHHIGYGLTQDGNQQAKYILYPLYRDRMAVLIAEFGIEKAAGQVADWVARKK